MVVRTLMESLPDPYRFVLISRDARGSLDQDPLAQRIDLHIPWFGKKDAPHPEFYRTRRETLDRLLAIQPDLVHFHSGGVFSWGNRWPGASWPAWLKQRNIRSVWTDHLVVDRLHGFCGANKPRLFKELVWPFARWGKGRQIAAVERELCVSEDNCRKMKAWYPLQSDRISCLYHSRIDADRLEAPKEEGREKLILAVGHLAPRKGQHILVQAFCGLADSYPDWRLALVGPEEDAVFGGLIQRLVQDRGIPERIQRVGPQNNISDWLKRCSIFVQPSFQEGLPLALQEAMAAGCPVLATQISGNPELVENGQSGYLVEAGNVQAMGDKLRWLMDHPQHREAMGKRGFQRIHELGMTKQSMTRAHDKMYREIQEANRS